MKLFELKLRLIAPVVLLCGFVFFSSQSARATCTPVNGGSGVGATDTNTVLMLATTLTDSSGSLTGNLCTSVEAVQANALGFNVEIDDAAAWGAKSTAQFASYRAIVLGDPNCAVTPAPVAEAGSTTGTWGPAITGRVAIVGTDPEDHSIANGATLQGNTARQLTENAVAYATSLSGQPGAYISLSCYYFNSAANTAVPVLAPFGSFTVQGTNWNVSTIVASSNPLVNTPNMLNNTGLSNWGNSSHEGFNGFPGNFTAVVNTQQSATSTPVLPYILTSNTQTATLGGPGTTTILTFNTDTYKVTGVNNQGGERLTVTAFLVPSSAFPVGFLPSFPGETIIPFADYSAAAGVPTGVEFQATCVTATGATCNFFYVLKTGFTLPPSLSGGIGGVDYLVAHGQSCPLTPTSNVQSIFLSYLATVTDPTDTASSDGPSCFAPTYTPGATPITTGTTSRFAGWQSPVDNNALNQVQAGATRPLTFTLLDISGNPVTNLSLCNSFTFTPSTGNVCNDIPTVPKPWVNFDSFGIVCPNGSPINPLTDGTIDSPGNATLNNNGGGNYAFPWKTVKVWSGSCANVVVILDSGLKVVPATIGFQFK